MNALDPAMRRRALWATTIGNALEWYDFTVFGQFAGTIGKLFFPGQDPSAQMLSAFAVFGGAFVARPLGGLFFGIFADRVGRRRALVAIVVMMGIGTAAIGLLPTYAAVGVLAPLGLLVARLVQGFSAGGEFGSSTAMLLEFAGRDRRGYYASYQLAAQAVALVLGAGVGALLNGVLSAEALHSWGWRLPFLAGAVIVPVGFYLRRAVEETPEFKAFLTRPARVQNTPLRDAVTRYPRELLAGTLIVGGTSATVYTMNIFLPHFAATTLKLDLASAQLGVVVSAVALAIVLPAIGYASDLFGRRTLMVPGALLFLVLTLALANRLVAAPSNENLWLLQSCTLVSALVSGPLAALLTEIFPIGSRSTGASLAYNFGVIVFGGFAPYVNSWLVRTTGDPLSPFYYLSVCVGLTVVGLFILPRRAAAGGAEIQLGAP